MKVSSAPELGPPPSTPPAPPGRSGLRQRIGQVFEAVLARPVNRAMVVGALLTVAAMATYSLLRVGGHGPFNSVWAEDGAIAKFAALFPVTWGPAVLSTVAALVLMLALQGRTSPQWWFAALAGTQSIVLLCGQIPVQGKLELRYAYIRPPCSPRSPCWPWSGPGPRHGIPRSRSRPPAAGPTIQSRSSSPTPPTSGS